MNILVEYNESLLYGKRVKAKMNGIPRRTYIYNNHLYSRDLNGNILKEELDISKQIWDDYEANLTEYNLITDKIIREANHGNASE